MSETVIYNRKKQRLCAVYSNKALCFGLRSYKKKKNITGCLSETFTIHIVLRHRKLKACTYYSTKQ